MITHFAGVTLQTLSIEGAKQFYHGILGFPIARESSPDIEFRPTPDCVLSFREVGEPIAPAHLAFEVPYAEFDAIAKRLSGRVALLKHNDGTTVDRYETGVNVYFKDFDGHLLELIAHPDISIGSLSPSGPYRILYIREVGLPVQDPVAAREWMKRTLGLAIERESEQFAFVIGGSAHAVVVSTMRRWIPIAMHALPPALEIVYGVANAGFIASVRNTLDPRLVISDRGDELWFRMYDYRIGLRVTDGEKGQ